MDLISHGFTTFCDKQIDGAVSLSRLMENVSVCQISEPAFS